VRLRALFGRLALVVLEELGPEESLSTRVALELVLGAMPALVLHEVGPAGEALPTLRTLERLNAAVRDDVRLQLIRAVKLLLAA
jgi:hypothetical protein